MNPTATVSKKRQRTAATRNPSTNSDQTLPDLSLNRNHHSPAATAGLYFNDASTADVILRLFIDALSPLESSSTTTAAAAAAVNPVSSSDRHVYLHSTILQRSNYFSALLSDRWNRHVNAALPPEISSSAAAEGDKKFFFLNLGVSLTPGFKAYLTVLELLYTNDFATVIDSASTALDLLPAALKLLFEDCVRSCVGFLEAVPWTEEEEKRVLNIIPFLSEEESKDLLARVKPVQEDSCEVMLGGLISSAIYRYQNSAYVKAFVAKILRDVSSRESAKSVLDKAFKENLNIVKKSMEDFSSPIFRGNHSETEAMQRLNLHKALTNGKQLLWLVERMVDLRVADEAVKEWSEQDVLTLDFQKAFCDDAWRNIVPGLPVTVIRCTFKLANAVSSGTILASRQVRKKLVEYWLPVLVVCRDNHPPVTSINKSLYLELEETFLGIISTLPMSDSQELLQLCLSFSTRNVEDCSHLVTAFSTWFRRAAQPHSPPDQ